MRKLLIRLAQKLGWGDLRRIRLANERLSEDVAAMRQVVTAVLTDEYVRRELESNPRYQDRKRLTTSEFKVFSQTGEDGIIEEIFNRIGTSNQVFVELGAGDGTENNTTHLLLKGWTGSQVDADPANIEAMQSKLAALIGRGALTARREHITRENVEDLLRSLKVPPEPDLLSIDIDGNDFWVWQNIEHFKPRVAVVEYNAVYRPPLQWVMKYNPTHSWDGTSYFGASLKSLEILGAQKGYRLVGCNFAGCNAFFVREDLTRDLFSEPFTAENHYEPVRYFLVRELGHPRSFGDFVSE